MVVNPDKTKIMIFNKVGKRFKDFTFKLNNATIDIVENYRYKGFKLE